MDPSYTNLLPGIPLSTMRWATTESGDSDQPRLSPKLIEMISTPASYASSIAWMITSLLALP